MFPTCRGVLISDESVTTVTNPLNPQLACISRLPSVVTFGNRAVTGERAKRMVSP